MPRKYNLSEIESSIKSFLESEVGRAIKSPAADLVASGIISSFTMFQLIEFIEKKFKVHVDIAALRPESFNTLSVIARQISLWMSK